MWSPPGSQDEFDDFFGYEVRQPQIGAGDCHEAKHDGRRLRDLAAIGPLHALQLGPAGAQEGSGAIAAPERRPGRVLFAPGLLLCSVDAILGGGSASGLGTIGLGAIGLCDIGLALLQPVLGGRLRDGHSICPTHQRSAELVGLAGGVIERARDVGSELLRLGGRRASCLTSALGRPAAPARCRAPPLAALLCAFAVTSHGGDPALTRLPVARVPAAEAAVLAQGDAIGVVALALVGLVIAMFAVLAGEGYCDSNVSARHVEVPTWS